MEKDPFDTRTPSPFGGWIQYPPFPLPLGELHTHTTCEIYCVFRGTGYYVIEGMQHKLEHGKVFLMRPGEVHRVFITSNEPYDRITCNFRISDVDAMDPQRSLLAPFFDRPLGERNVYPHSAVASTHIYDLFARLYADMGSKYATQLNTRITLFSILSELKRLFDDQRYFTPDQDCGQIRAVLNYVNGHLTEPLCVDALCQQFFMSRSQLNREFKRATGTTVWDYVMSKRLMRAKMHISNGMRAGEAAIACGFRDYSAFYRSYLKKYGTPPSFGDR